jgi:hypothetical protein
MATDHNQFLTNDTLSLENLLSDFNISSCGIEDRKVREYNGTNPVSRSNILHDFVEI